MFYIQVDFPQLEKYFEKMIDIFHPADELFLKTGGDLCHWCYDENNWKKCIRYGKLILLHLR